MKTSPITRAVLAFLATAALGSPLRAAVTNDISWGYRMPAGWPGDINRGQHFDARAVMLDAANPPRWYGEFLTFGTANNVRPILAADQHNSNTLVVHGMLVRPYPTQQETQTSMNVAIGAAVPPQKGIVDSLMVGAGIMKGKAGMVVKKGDPVFVWAIATASANIQGELQAAATNDSTIRIANARYAGPATAEGYVEVEIWKA